MQNSSQIATTNKSTPNFYTLDAFPVTQPTVKSIAFHGFANPNLTWKSSNPVFNHQTLLVTLQEGCQASSQPSDSTICQSVHENFPVGCLSCNIPKKSIFQSLFTRSILLEQLQVRLVPPTFSNGDLWLLLEHIYLSRPDVQCYLTTSAISSEHFFITV